MKSDKCSEPGPVPKKRRRIHIRKPQDAIRLLNKVINSLWNDECPVDKARTLIYAASTIVKTFEVVTLEERLTELERIMEAKE